MVLFRTSENEPSKMHNVRPYVYSMPWHNTVTHVLLNYRKYLMTFLHQQTNQNYSTFHPHT